MKAGIFFGAFAGASWGLVFLPPALLPGFHPLLLTCGRFVAYGVLALCLLLPILRRLRRKWSWQYLPALIRLSLSSNIIYFMLLSAAVQRIGIAATSLIIGLLPLTITLLGRSKHDAPSLTKLLWPMLAVLAGVACINIEALSQVESLATDWYEPMLGLLMAVGALASWSWYAWDNARALERTKFDSNEWSLLVGLMTGFVAAGVWGGIDWLAPVATPPAGDHQWTLFWGLNLLLALVSSWLGYMAWNACTRRLPLTLTGQMVVFETLFALAYGFAYLQRLPSTLEAISIVLLVGGVVASVRLHAEHRGELVGRPQPVTRTTGAHGGDTRSEVPSVTY